MGNKTLKIIASLIVLAVFVFVVWIFSPKQPSFCFNFVHDMQFGDREVKNPVNEGIRGLRGMMYFPDEIAALHAVLINEGYYLDPLEKTGGQMYMGAFFGPSTQVAVREFQKKNNLEQTGVVDNETIDVLAQKYSCPKNLVATSTSPTTTIAK